MSSPSARRLAFLIITAALLASGAAFILRYGVGSLSRVPGWAISSAKLRLALEQDPSAGAFYDRTMGGPLPLAAVVKEMHAAWPDLSIAAVHGAALEVGTALLHRGDIEMGEWVGGKFVPSTAAPWQDNARMVAEVKARNDFLEDEHRFVFRRK